MYPRAEISTTTDQIENELKESRYVLHELLQMLDYSSVHQHYEGAVKGLCEGALLGLTLMTVAGLAMAFLLTLLVRIYPKIIMLEIYLRYCFLLFNRYS